MPESAKECDTVLPEGLDIGLGSRDRAFESPHSDQNPSEINDFRGIFLLYPENHSLGEWFKRGCCR